MDKRVEDKMVRQIEQNLHNNIDENIYFAGRSPEKDKLSKKNANVGTWKAVPEVKEDGTDHPIVSLDYYSPVLPVSRSEYIRQARESCLRQLSAMQSSASAYDSYYLDNAIQNAKQETNKKSRPYNTLFHEGSEAATEEDNLKEVAAFRFLMVRMVCALLLFLSIFLIDKFDIKVGNFNSDKVQEYVTGKDNLKQLEEFVISFLKE